MADITHPEPPRPSPWVAVVFETVDDTGADAPIYLSNRGPVVDADGNQYEPRLTNLPILLGQSINVQQYGEPVQAQPNGGTISFAIGDGPAGGDGPPVYEWLSYHWQARKFSVYEGNVDLSDHGAPVVVDDDMELVYVGYVYEITHDSFTVTVQTTDASILLNVPLVTNFYDETFPPALQGRPKPYLWGTGFSLAAPLEQEITQTYRVSANPVGLCEVFALRVGGVPWTQVDGECAQGQWRDNGDGTVSLGASPLDSEVRCDATQGVVGLQNPYSVACFLVLFAETFGLDVDVDALTELNFDAPVLLSYWSGINPVNVSAAISDVMNGAGCWWGINALGEITAGAIKIPGDEPSYTLTAVEINSLSLSNVQPEAWRIRVGYQRNWQPETNFLPAVLQATQMQQSVPAQINEPHFENDAALEVEPLAVDVPLLLGTTPLQEDAVVTQHRLSQAWGVNRTFFDVTVWMLPDQIELYDTVGLDYITLNDDMAAGNFLIVSAVRAIGGCGPSTLQLWGTLGEVPDVPAPPPAPPFPCPDQPPLPPPAPPTPPAPPVFFPRVPALARVYQVEEITYTIGTGPYTMAGATAGYFRFADAYNPGELIYYKVNDGDLVEVNQGIFDGLEGLSRGVIASSNGALPINWSGNTRPLVWPLVVLNDIAELIDTVPTMAMIGTGNTTAGIPQWRETWLATLGSATIQTGPGQGPNLTTPFPNVAIFVFACMYQDLYYGGHIANPAVSAITGSTVGGWQARAGARVTVPHGLVGGGAPTSQLAAELWWATSAFPLTNEQITVTFNDIVDGAVVGILAVHMENVANPIWDNVGGPIVETYSDPTKATNPNYPGQLTIPIGPDLVLGWSAVFDSVGTINDPSDDGSIFMSDVALQAIQAFIGIDLSAFTGGFFVPKPANSPIPRPASFRGGLNWIFIGDAITGTGTG